MRFARTKIDLTPTLLHRPPRPAAMPAAVRRSSPPIRLHRTAPVRRLGEIGLRRDRPILRNTLRAAPSFTYTPASAFEPTGRISAFEDYGRHFTAEGGIAFVYKDFDERLSQVLIRLLQWIVAMAYTVAFVRVSPVDDPVFNGLGVMVLAVIYALILAPKGEVYRSVEVRPDCFIVEQEDVFWRDQMPLGPPSFERQPGGDYLLSGVYGSRYVAYLTVRRFDEHDRTPQVLAAQLAAAFQQLWN